MKPIPVRKARITGLFINGVEHPLPSAIVVVDSYDRLFVRDGKLIIVRPWWVRALDKYNRWVKR